MKNFVAIFALALCVACVKQDLPEGWDGRGCPVTFGIELEYRIDVDGDNVLLEEIGGIHIFVFDATTGVLYDIITLSGDQIKLGRIPAYLPPGKYDFIAWGGGHGYEDMQTSGFNDLHMYDALTQRFDEGARIGRTTLTEFRMKLGVGDPDTDGHYAPRVGNFSDIFYAQNRGYMVTGQENQTVPLTFVRDSHMIQVRAYGVRYIQGTRADAESPLRVYITGRNGSYHHDNTIDPHSKVLHYENGAHHVVEDDEVHSDIKVLHLNKEYHTGDNKMELVVRYDEKNFEIRLDLLEFISRMTDEHGAQRYPTQEHISKEKVFLVPLHFEPDGVEGAVRVVVDDWVIGYYRPREIVPWIPV
jgi:hypothetical protein